LTSVCFNREQPGGSGRQDLPQSVCRAASWIPSRKDDSHPRLKRTPGSGNGPVDVGDNGKTPKGDEDERPTLKKRPSDQ